MDELIKEILKFGILPTFLLVVLFLIIQDPDRAIKIRALITEPFFKFFKWFSREHISSTVSSHANEFLNSSIFSQLTHSERFKIKVKWVKEQNDPILSEDGTLILRMKEDDDQTKNILSAVHVALPHVTCPLIRSNINSTCEKSIDLTVLKKLSEKLGQHGRLTYKKYFLDPETEDDKSINDLIKKLVELDRHGFFVPIFINELELLSEGLYAENDKTDYSEQVIQFIEYLLTIINRPLHSEIELEYFVNPFKVSTILLAKAQRADSQGLKPYLRRLKINLDKGSESVYIIAYPLAFDFFERLLNSLESYERIFIKKEIKTQYYSELLGRQSNLKIAVLTRNDVFVDGEFEQVLNSYNLKEGSKVKGLVEDVSQKESLISVMGLRAYISKYDCSWSSISNCEEVLKVGHEYDFIIKKIDKTSNYIYLTKRLPETNPWDLVDLPKLNSTVEIELVNYDTIKFIGVYQNSLEIYIQMEEMSWFFLTPNQCRNYIGTTVSVKVINIDEDNEKIYCSLRQTEMDPWPKIHQSLQKGMEFTGRVTDITSNYIQVKLPNNFLGIIPKESLDKAGFEYSNFEDNVVIGQGIEVVISKVFIARRRIRLDLKRNKK